MKVIELEQSNPKIGQEIIALGQPKGQSNAITFGDVNDYATVTLSNTEIWESNVKFPVIVHSANTNSGSSGGAILSTELKIVGIHYAGSKNSAGEFVRGYAIPLLKVREFAEAYL